MKPETRRTLIVAIIGLIALLIGIIVFDETQSRQLYDGPEYYEQAREQL